MLNSNKLVFKSYKELSKDELYAIMALRLEVFCVEQNCPYQDVDYNDQEAQHVFIMDDNKLAAYARILNSQQKTAIVGRVVVAKTHRSYGLAKKIMRTCLDFCKKQTQIKHIEISAQSYLHDFYQGLGFKSMGKYYLEDDIPHEFMRLSF